MKLCGRSCGSASTSISVIALFTTAPFAFTAGASPVNASGTRARIFSSIRTW